MVKENRDIKIGFHYHCPAVIKDKRIYIDGPIGLFIDSIAPFFKMVFLFLGTPGKDDPETFDYSIRSPNVKLVDIGKKYGLAKRLLRFGKMKAHLLRKKKEIDFFLIRVPTPYLPNLSSLLYRKKIPFGIYLVGDNLSGIKSMKSGPFTKFLLWLYYSWYQSKLEQALSRSLAMTNSMQLKSKFETDNLQLRVLKSTTLSNSQIIDFPQKQIHSPLRVLYVGRIDYSKGLDTILKACNYLDNSFGIRNELKCVGPLFKGGKEYLAELKDLARVSGREKNFQYLGYKKAGSEELRSVYLSSDIFCIASRSDFEGFPRVIWEALNAGLPVVARPMGSIPFYLKDQKEALFFEKDDPVELAEKIHSLVSDEILRGKLFKAGKELVKENTLEIQGEKFATEISGYLDDLNKELHSIK